MQQVMRRLALGVFLAVLAGSLFTVPLLAGRAHFVGDPDFQISGDTVLVSGRVAGLGNVPQITVTVSGEAACINPGGNKPSAENKQSFSSTGTFPVQNGRADFSQILTADLQPNCTPPMTLVWSDLSVVVTAEDGTLLTYRFR
jgi:hypothetical protein